jgi:hypothetical protein
MLSDTDAKVSAITPWKQPFPRTDDLPIDTKKFEKGLGKWDQPILPALPLANVDHHPRAIDIRGSEANRLRNTQSGGVTGHQDGPVLHVGDAREESENLLPAWDRGETLLWRRAGDLRDVPGLLQGDLVEEPEGGNVVTHHAVRNLGLVD